MTISAEAEIRLINQFFNEYRINAAIPDSLEGTFVAPGSYAVFGIRLQAGATIKSIERVLPELSERLSGYRGGAVPIRLRKMPLALELPHPSRQPVELPDGAINVDPHTMLLGQGFSFDGKQGMLPVNVTLDLRRVPHVLLAGTTGSGKSTLMRIALLSLLTSTSPDDLELVLIDLKNEDLTDFEQMPHVTAAGWNLSEAVETIHYVDSIKRERVRNRRWEGRRVLLVIDELAELGRSKEVGGALASILAIGRSKRINVLAATQKPTAAVVGSVAKANFTTRLTGQVLSARDSETATGMPNCGAEMLPGQGAFLRVEGARIDRFQVYWADDLDQRLDAANARWRREVQSALPFEWVVGK